MPSKKDAARDRQTSGSKSSDRKDTPSFSKENTSSGSKKTTPANDRRDVDFSSSSKESKKAAASSVKGKATSKRPDFTGPEKDTRKDEVIAAQQQQIELLSANINADTALPPVEEKSIDQILAESGFVPDQNAPANPPNPEMGGSDQRKSQQDLIESPEFERFMRDVKEENTIADHITDFFSPIRSVPTVNQETGEFGVTSEFNPAKMNPGTRALDTLFDLGLTVPLDDFTSASDLAERRRDRTGGKTSGEISSDRRDSDKSTSTSDTDGGPETDTPGGDQDETDILAQFFEDFFGNFGGFGGTPTGPQQGVPGTGQPVNPNFQLIGNPDFIAKVTGNPNFGSGGG